MLSLELNVEESRVSVRLHEHATLRMLLDEKTRIQAEIRYGTMPLENTSVLNNWGASFEFFKQNKSLIINLGLVSLVLFFRVCVFCATRNTQKALTHSNTGHSHVYFHETPYVYN